MPPVVPPGQQREDQRFSGFRRHPQAAACIDLCASAAPPQLIDQHRVLAATSGCDQFDRCDPNALAQTCQILGNTAAEKAVRVAMASAAEAPPS